MLESLKNIFAVADLRKRVLFTLGLLAVYRVGGHIPTPGINPEALALLADQAKNTMFGLYDMFSGKNLSQMTIFALGIMPYISASIILQLLTVVWPYLERLSKEGELGRRKITQYTRYGTIVLSVVQALGIALFLERNTEHRRRPAARLQPGLGLPAADRADADDRARRSSCGWASRSPSAASATACRSSSSPASSSTCRTPCIVDARAAADRADGARPAASLLVVLMVVVIARDRLRRARAPARDRPVRQARRRPPDVRRVEHAHSAEGEHRRRHPGHLRLVDPGVPGDAGAAVHRRRALRLAARAIEQIAPGMPLHDLLYVVGIIFFCYFYTAIIFNPDDVAENMRKYGGFIPGIRPGKRTAEYIDTILTRITLVGAIYLAMVAILPKFLISGFKVAPIPFIGERLDAVLPRFITEGMGVQFFFGGTSLLIIVGVAMDTVQQVESQLIMRHYDGFMKKTRIRGRRGQ